MILTKPDPELIELRANLSIAEENLLLSKARYAGGSGLSIEVLDAIQAASNIKILNRRSGSGDANRHLQT